MSHPLAVWLEQLRLVFAKETLPPPPENSPVSPSGKGIAKLLFSIERLPVEPERARGRRRPSLLALLFAPEPLARDPERAPRRHTRWLAWLFLPERIDRGTDSPKVD